MKIVADYAILPYTPQAFRVGSLRGIGHPQLLPILQDLLQRRLDIAQATAIYRTRPHPVWALTIPAELPIPYAFLVVKQFGWRNVLPYLASPWCHAKAWKAYRTACHLLSHDLPTPLPLGVGERRLGGLLRDNVYITAALPDSMTLQTYVETRSTDALDAMRCLVAAYVRRMHASGLWHRDLTLGNFLLQGPPGHTTLYLVDLNRAWRLPSLPLWLRAIDLARLEWPVEEAQFYTDYCAEAGDAAQLLRIVRLYRLWRVWRRRLLMVLRPWRLWQRATAQR